MKKAQTWSLEAMIAMMTFTLLFVALIAVLYTNAKPSVREIVATQTPLLSKLSASDVGDTPVAFLEDNVVNTSRLNTLMNYTYADLKAELGLKDDFCILFVDDEGNVIPINGSVGFGSSQISIGNYTCGSKT